MSPLTVCGRTPGKRRPCGSEIVILGRCAGGDQYDRYRINLVLDAGDAEIPLEKWEKTWEPRMRRQTRCLFHRYYEKIIRLAEGRKA